MSRPCLSLLQTSLRVACHQRLHWHRDVVGQKRRPELKGSSPTSTKPRLESAPTLPFIFFPPSSPPSICLLSGQSSKAPPTAFSLTPDRRSQIDSASSKFASACLSPTLWTVLFSRLLRPRWKLSTSWLLLKAILTSSVSS